jgi:hexosaminidase
MKEKHLTDVEELQGYFMQRIAKYVRSKGREVMGWDELTNSSLPEGSIIFGWQGMGEAALKAAAQGHQFVMTPARILYLIRYQGPQWFEPLTYFGNNTLEDVYNYEPVQTSWKEEYKSLLMGVQASMWTEFCKKPADVDYMLFPRLAALAEVAWTRPENKQWGNFLKSVDAYDAHIAQKGVVYARSMYNIQHKVTPSKGKLHVVLDCIRPDVKIRYTIDGTTPTVNSPLYTHPIVLDRGTTVRCATFSGRRQMGKMLSLPISWNKATAKKVISSNLMDSQLLTNGLRGSNKYTDFEWCTSANNDSISFVIDLNKVERLNRLTLGCITNYGMAVHNPKLIRIELSDNNRLFSLIRELRLTAKQIFKEGCYTTDYHFDLKGKKARYIRIVALGAGLCPDNHVRPGQVARMYFDEAIVE